MALGIGIIGCGVIGQTLSSAFLEYKGSVKIELRAFCDVNLTLATSLAQKLSPQASCTTNFKGTSLKYVTLQS